MKNVLIIIDKIEKLNWMHDSSLYLAHYAQSILNYNIYISYQNDFSLKDGKLFCNASKFFIQNYDDSNPKYLIDEKKEFESETFQFILIRLNPPFDIRYLSLTWMLDFVSKDKTLVINEPSSFQKFSEKLIVHNFSQKFQLPSIVSNNFSEISEFLKIHEEIVVKPINNYGGFDIFFIKKEDRNLNAILEILNDKYKDQPFIIQKFYSNIEKDGDKRIFLINGEILGAFKRIPKENSNLVGITFGGRHQKCEISKEELEICKEISPFLKNNGLYFVGIDIFEEKYLNEINLTSPTGLRSLERLYERCIAQEIWNDFEKIFDNLT